MNVSLVKLSGIGVLLIFLSVVGCASGPQTYPSLDQARTAVNNAASDAQVAQRAPLALQEAKEALQAAEQAAQQEAEKERVQHLAYLAEQRAQIAQELAQKQSADALVERLSVERTQVEELARTRSRAQQLESELAALEAKLETTPRGMVLTLGNILFEYDRAQLKPGFEKQLEPLADYLQEDGNRRLLIEGYTDSTGPASYNQKLSQQRAQEVASFLIAQGISEDRILTRGYGEQYPVATNETQAGRLQNRRVEVVLMNGGESPPERKE